METVRAAKAAQSAQARSWLERAADAALSSGRGIFAFAIIAIGVETVVCARLTQQPLGPGYNALPVIPWVPAIPLLALTAAAVWIACGVGMLFRRWLRGAALTFGALYTLMALVVVLPFYSAHPGDMGLRTVVLEPLSLACIAFLLPGRDAIPRWLGSACRWVFAFAMIVFGVDHFLGLAFIGSLLPDWIPWHLFWVGFFGVVFMVGAVGIAFGIFARWSWAAIGLMFALWVVTLHLPRTLGFYSIPGAITDPNEWSSLFIAVGLWGGPWAMAAQANGGKP